MSRSTRGADYQDIPRPIAAMADEYPPGHHDPRHHHKRAQLIYACAGVTVVVTGHASFVVPPQRAVWVPAGVEHEAHMRGHVSLRTLYIDSTAFPNLPQTCRVIEVSGLLRELIIEACRIPVEYDPDGRDGRVMSLLMTELLAMPTTPLDVPMPRDERLVKVCTAILRDPAQHDALDDWADAAGMGRRTFTRTFRRETGISFATWRQNVRLMEALSRLAVGQPVTTVAYDVGYNSPSAFTAMFRRAFGSAPTQYLASIPGTKPTEPHH
jgi:AraC-like DNA-binding protein